MLSNVCGCYRLDETALANYSQTLGGRCLSLVMLALTEKAADESISISINGHSKSITKSLKNIIRY